MIAAFLIAAQLSAPTQGYYAGLSTLYPYKPVYCDSDEMIGKPGACYGSHGDLVDLPKSAPLPITEKWCVWADNSVGFKPIGNGWAAATGDGWYQWKPRIVPTEKQKYYGDRVCYWEDRGEPKNINDLKRDDP